MNDKTKPLLILGRGGFVGRSLTEYFTAAGYSVTALGHGELDLLDEGAVRRYFKGRSFDVVIQAAVWNPAHAPAGELGREAEMNLRMYRNVAACGESFGRMIYFGSGAEYDKRRDIVSAREEELEGPHRDAVPLPHTPYGLSKRVIGELIEGSEKAYNLRIFGLYGRYEDYRVKFITGCCAKAALGLPLTIRQNVFFDYLYIDDFCRMVERFINLDNPAHRTYNIVSGRRVDLMTLAKLVREVSGRDLPIYVCREGLAREYTADGTRLQDEIDYHEFVSHREAVRELLAYFEEHADDLDKQALLYQA